MKQFFVRNTILFLLLALAVSFAACSRAGSETETSAQESVGETETSAQESLPEDGADETETSKDTSSGTSATPAEKGITLLDRNGNAVKLSDFYGKPIVLNFWASWCPPCKAELPDFDAAYKKYEGEVVFLMVNMTDGDRETVATAKQFVESMGYTFPVYFDTKYEAAYAFGVSSIPQTYFFDADGNVVARATGLIYANQLEEGISKIYSK